MRSWVKRHWLLSLFLLVGGVPAALNISGYCWEQNRWLSDQEKIYLVIQNLILHQNVTIYTKDKGTQMYQAVPYNSVADFMQNNLNCCETDVHIGDDFTPRTFINTVTGKHADNIRVKYNAKYLDKDGKTQITPTKITPLISNCGKVRFGMWH